MMIEFAATLYAIETLVGWIAVSIAITFFVVMLAMMYREGGRK